MIDQTNDYTTSNRRNDAVEFADLLSKIGSLLTKYIESAETSTGSVYKATSAKSLSRPHDCTIQILKTLIAPQDTPDHGVGVDGIVDIVQTILDESVCTWSPRFMDKLFSGVHPIGAISELVCAVLNNNVHVFRASPALSTYVKATMFAKMFGFNAANGKAGGVLCPGGSYSNLLAITTARNFFLPDIRECSSAGSSFRYKDNAGPLIIFTSVQSHFSIVQSAVILGIGSKNVIAIPSDANGCMNAKELEKAVEFSLTKNARPFLVVATSGTTVLGAFDPLAELSRTSQKFGLWLHVDASWGGGVIISDKYKHLMAGSEGADSIVFNPHKVMSCPLLCSVLLLKDQSMLQSNSTDANYLFHSHDDSSQTAVSMDNLKLGPEMPPVDNWDLGKGTLGCGRRGDILKLYLTWTYYGPKSISNAVDDAMELSMWFTGIIQSPSDLKNLGLKGIVELAHTSVQYLNICFFFYPSTHAHMQCLRQSDYQKWKEYVDRTTKVMHRHLLDRGNFMVDYAPILAQDGSRGPASWRLVTQHRLSSRQHLIEFLRELDVIGETLMKKEIVALK